MNSTNKFCRLYVSIVWIVINKPKYTTFILFI